MTNSKIVSIGFGLTLFAVSAMAGNLHYMGMPEEGDEAPAGGGHKQVPPSASVEDRLTALEKHSKSRDEQLERVTEELYRVSINSGFYDKLIPLLDSILELNPKRADWVNFNKAVVYQTRLGDVQNALHFFEKVSPNAPEYGASVEQRAYLMAGLGNMNEALDMVEKLEKKNPKDASLKNTKANLLVMTRRYEEAMKPIEEGLALRPDSADLMNLKAYALAEMGIRLDEARTVIDKVMAMPGNATNGPMLDTQAWVIAKQALEKQRKGAKPGEVKRLLAEAMEKFKDGLKLKAPLTNFPEALKNLQTATKKDINSRDAQQMYTHSLQKLANALNFNRNMADSYEHVVQIYEWQNENAKANEFVNRKLKEGSFPPDVQQKLMELKARLSQPGPMAKID